MAAEVAGIVAHMVVVRFCTKIHPVNFFNCFKKTNVPFFFSPQVDTVVAPEGAVAAMAAVLVADMVETLEEDDIESF